MGMQGAGGTKGIYARFTRAILASLIISERWFANTSIHVEVQDVKAAGVPEQDRQEARELVRLAEEATEAKQFQRAAVLFYEALAVNPANYDTVQARGEWLLRFQNYRDAARDAVILQRLDPDRPAGYVLLGRACLGYKNYLRAREAFREAVPLVHAFDEKLPILQDLDKAQDALGAELKAIEQAASEKEIAALMRARRIADLDPMGRTIASRPAKDEQQLEGLFLFAERMQWPYLEAVRPCAKKACEDWLALHEPIYPVQMDWLFAVMLPGKHFAHVLMAMLVLSTPAIQSVGMAPNSECGVALPECSYWRSRSVLGRVLGCLPGVTSLNG
jgi:tetratricopeptide (TPR) repeat protein